MSNEAQVSCRRFRPKKQWILLLVIVVVSFLSMKRTKTIVMLSDRSLEITTVEIIKPSLLIQQQDKNHTDSQQLENDHHVKSKKKEKCIPMASWQTSHYPSCNSIHEMDMITNSELLASGSYRHVWMVREYDGITKRVLKTLRYQRDFDSSNFHKHLRDAIALQKLSSSPYIVDIYGYCSNSALVDYTADGDLTRLHFEKKNLTKKELLVIAHDVAASIADAHEATIVHSDIKPNQFLNFEGKYMLNDFNRAHFLKWNSERNESCGFWETKNWGAWRSPEEYLYKQENEAIDVYSLGHILHFILTGNVPFGNMSNKKAIAYVKKGGRVQVTDNDILSSTHPFETSLLKAMDMCFVFDPKKRASAREVTDLLQQALNKVDQV